MIKSICHTRFPLLVYPPLKVFSLEYCIKISDSGAMPVLDTEFFPVESVLRWIDDLENAGILFGIRLTAGQDRLLTHLEEKAPANLDLVVISPDWETGRKFAPLPNFPQARVLVEVRDIGLADALSALAPHGLILKGSEAPGLGSRHTAFILLQWYLGHTSLPIFVHGGVGLYTAAGMFAAGASGLVLDNQLFLAEEAPLAAGFKGLMARLEERDTAVVGLSLNTPFRVFARPGTGVVRSLLELESRLADTSDPLPGFREAVRSGLAPLDREAADPMQSLFFLGQDAVFAKHFARKGRRLKEMIEGLFQHVDLLLEKVDAHDPLCADSPLAREFGTTYPVIQGPMANISDKAEFALKVFESGGLPFMALGSLPAHLAETIMAEAAREVPRFGAGLIGIEALNRDLDRHMELVKAGPAPFALFAGGVPAQVKELEAAGTRTYLHTPSPMMLEQALDRGLTGFIFEGTEAGGHVGNLTSLTLWELAVERMTRLDDRALSGQTLIFAGGIGTSSASHFISGMTAFLAARGARIGLQVGTAYLFTEEIVATGALQKLYQEILCQENETILVGKTVGLPARTAATPFSHAMKAGEHRRVRDGLPLTERKAAFEKENIGALLIAAKAFCPDFDSRDPVTDEVRLAHFSETECLERGNFLTGDALAFACRPATLKEIHARLFECKKRLFAQLGAMEARLQGVVRDEIAVVGMGCIYPDASSPARFWENIVARRVAIRAMPAKRLNLDLYFDPDRKAADKTYSRIAGVIEDFVFDHAAFGYSAEEAAAISRSQQMLLTAALQAAADAGLSAGSLPDPARTAVIIGTCLTSELNNDLQLKYCFPEIRHCLEQMEEFKALPQEARETLLAHLKKGLAGPHRHENPAGATLNVEASRVAAHLGAEGLNYTVDAACASSLAAVDCAMLELLSHRHDLVVVGGVNTNLSPESFVGFSKMGALSDTGSFPFDRRADGFVLGEGAGVLVMKRMKDALRDGDAIHGVIKAVGSASDGRGRAIAAPNAKGQVLAMERCYQGARSPLIPGDITYIEAHGTGTLLGDETEIRSLQRVYGRRENLPPVGVSSVKSQIGHLLGGAGNAGLIKTLLALKHRTLPPNGPFEAPAGRLELNRDSLFIIREPAPWKAPEGVPRRAAVSAYGFGGINYHVVVEEFTPAYRPLGRRFFGGAQQDVQDRTVVVAGMGVKLPGADSAEDFWQRLKSGQDVLAPLPENRFHNAAYARETDPAYQLPMLRAGVIRDDALNPARYRIPPNTARSIDRQQFFALDAASQALKQAGLELGLENRLGAVIGTMSGEKHVENIIRTRIALICAIVNQTPGLSPETLTAISGRVAEYLADRYPVNSEDTVPGLLSNIVAGRIANVLGLGGANFTVDAGSASSAVALHQAILSLNAGIHDFVLTGGVDANLSPTLFLAFKKFGLISPEACRVFDKRAAGIQMSEGAVLFLLTTRKKAREHGMPVLGEIKGLGFHASPAGNLMSPSAASFKEAIQKVYQEEAVRPREVEHLDLFGFGNLLFDRIEYQATARCFDLPAPERADQQRPSKPVRFGNIKPEFGYFRAANPAVALAKLLLMARKGEFLPFHSFSPEHSILPSRGEPAGAGPKVPGRSRFLLAANLFGFGGNHAHLLIAPPAGSETARKAEKMEVRRPSLRQVALLSGQGAQYPGMMRELYRSLPVIRGRMDAGEAVFRRLRGYSLLNLMFGASEALHATENTQPAVFLSTAALFDELGARGFRADAFIGHSIGEYSALYCAGLLGFEACMELILKRADLMQEAGRLHPGRIMVVFQGAGQTAALIDNYGLETIWIANKNSDRQTAVAGSAAEIEAFCRHLKEREVLFRLLNLSGAFHTPLMATAAEGIKDHLENLPFKECDFTRIFANATGRPYPADERAVKELLVRQMTAPVEFTAAVTRACELGAERFVEIGPHKILTGILKDIPTAGHVQRVPAVDPKTGPQASLEACAACLGLSPEKGQTSPGPHATPHQPSKEPLMPLDMPSTHNNFEFQTFLKENESRVREILEGEFRRHQQKKALAGYEEFGFYTRKLLIAGVAVGLPGTARRVFNADNFEKLFAGHNFIEPLTPEEKEKIADLNISRVYKDPAGNARLLDISDPSQVIQLAGKLGYFNLREEYDVPEQYDLANALAIAAGIEALKDAGIPLLVPGPGADAGGGLRPRYRLPAEMRETTGVIMTSLFPGLDTLINEMNAYYYNKFYVRPYRNLEKIFYHLMERVKDEEIKTELTDWFFKIKQRRSEYGKYKFDRQFTINVIPLGSAIFAQLIGARGPNLHLSGACASTTQACAVAEDWIRSRRCDRVIIIGGEAATSRNLNRWVGSGFLALGAATIKNVVSDAAKPFDEERDGTILGSGAVSLIVEREDCVRARGLRGQAEILGTHMGNSAHHVTRMDVNHLAGSMRDFIKACEKRHGLSPEVYAPRLVFMSHETFTPARGGSAEGEVAALKRAFPDHYRQITITNTKGFTGHTLGAAIEDAVLVKALQKGMVPPIANLSHVPEAFQDLKLNREHRGDFEYGLHFAAGFGSHFAFIFLKKVVEKAAAGNPEYQAWLKRISGAADPRLQIRNNTLCLEAGQNEPGPAVDTPPLPLDNLSGERPAKKVPQPPASPPGGTLAAVQALVAEQTGYALDMLAPDLDLEADLGIDTVKQVEIFGKIAARFNLEVPEDLKLRELCTMARLAAYIDSRTGAGAAVTETGATAPATPSASTGSLAAVQALVAEQTGYALDMLAPDLDLEADLGIDTVKQVEIFGKIAARFNLEIPEDLKLRELCTMARLAAYIDSRTGAGAAVTEQALPPEKRPEDAPDETSFPAADPIRRFTVGARKTGLAAPAARDGFQGKTFLVTTDGQGFSDPVGKAIQAAGGRVITLGEGPENDHRLPFRDAATLPEHIRTLAARVPSIDGIFHLYPLSFHPDGYDRREAVQSAVKSLFLLIQAYFQTLDRPGTLIAAMGDNGAVCPYLETGAPVHPLFAGISGLLKTVNKELASTRVKMVDFQVSDFPARKADMAEILMDELSSGDKAVECGFAETAKGDLKRHVLTLRAEAPGKRPPFVRSGETILVTGGARGITFEIVKALADKFRPRLILLGRSDIDGIDPAFLPPEADEAFIQNRLREKMEGARPIEIKRAAGRILKIRETRANLEALKAGGVDVQYHAVDVLDAAGLAAVLRRSPDIDGVIHGAGIDAGSLIPKKEAAVFDRVFDTKVFGALNLIKALEKTDYRWFIAFSSITARFGNEGQCDYTAANDMLGKILQAEKVRHPRRIHKVIDWTAWEGTGMAAGDTVQKVLRKKGVSFLTIRRGAAAFLEELENALATEVVIAGEERGLDQEGLFASGTADPEFPFLEGVAAAAPGRITFVRNLDPARDRFLLDHALEGVPIFLGATGMEAMAEAACRLTGSDLPPVQVRDFAIPYGIKLLKERPRTVMIEAGHAAGDGRAVDCRIWSQFRNLRGEAVGEPKEHYRGTFLFGPRPAARSGIAVPDLAPHPLNGDAAGLIYHPRRLFMGDLFQSIQKVLSLDGDVLVTRLRDQSAKAFFSHIADPVFRLPVVLLDGMFQTGGLLEIFTTDLLVLPYRIAEMNLPGPTSPGQNYTCITRKTAADDETCTYDIHLVDEEGRLCLELKGFAMVRLGRVEREYRISTGSRVKVA